MTPAEPIRVRLRNGDDWDVAHEQARAQIQDDERYHLYKINRGWWRPNSSGYTNDRSEAGVYSAEEARDRISLETGALPAPPDLVNALSEAIDHLRLAANAIEALGGSAGQHLRHQADRIALVLAQSTGEPAQ